MQKNIDYYFTIVSPWAYIGDALFKATARKHRAKIVYRPVNLGEVFPASGGLPLAKRHPLRVAYRTMELKRWREKRGLLFALKPAGWPFDPTLADGCALALIARGVDPAPYVSAAFKAVFEGEKNLGDADEIASVLTGVGLPAQEILAEARGEAVKAAYAANVQRALEAGVFGSPSYVLDGEIFWGQDRIEALGDALTSGRKPFLAD